eukprot:scaffold11416_cov119-Isochrysis_galbana.AAC.12
MPRPPVAKSESASRVESVVMNMSSTYRAMSMARVVLATGEALRKELGMKGAVPNAPGVTLTVERGA